MNIFEATFDWFKRTNKFQSMSSIKPRSASYYGAPKDFKISKLGNDLFDLPPMPNDVNEKSEAAIHYFSEEALQVMKNVYPSIPRDSIPETLGNSSYPTSYPVFNFGHPVLIQLPYFQSALNQHDIEKYAVMSEMSNSYHFPNFPNMEEMPTGAQGLSKSPKKNLLKSSGEKSRQFVCEDCGSTFTRFPDLQRHHKCVHEGFKPFTCPQNCGMQFARKDALKRHLSKKGPGVPCAGFRR